MAACLLLQTRRCFARPPSDKVYRLTGRRRQLYGSGSLHKVGSNGCIGGAASADLTPLYTSVETTSLAKV